MYDDVNSKDNTDTLSEAIYCPHLLKVTQHILFHSLFSYCLHKTNGEGSTVRANQDCVPTCIQKHLTLILFANWLCVVDF